MILSPTSTRIAIYVTQAIISTALSGVTKPMLGDGTIDWPEFRYRWLMFSLGAIASAVGILRAYFDSTSNKEGTPTTVLVPTSTSAPVAIGVTQPPPANTPTTATQSGAPIPSSQISNTP